MPALPRLGPFELDRPIGAGGMGVVWRARHLDQDLSAAVKVLSAEVASDRAIRAAFRTEVRAVAALHHRNIVTILDHGEVPEEAARASDGALPAGAPYLVMEYAEHGSLEPWRGRLPWSRTREVLLALLDALAHAHARGVVHRDLKPANVLLTGRTLRVKLTDFGLAHLTRHDGTAAPLDAGTPSYMSTEQLGGAWRDYGPWTDLYALGNVAAALVAGRPPLAGLSLPQAYMRALTGKIPEVRPVVPVPDGFQDWLARLVASRPTDRFQRAADAAWALLSLGDAPDPEGAPDLPAHPAPDATQLVADRSTTRSTARTAGSVVALDFDARPGGPSLAERAPTPASWSQDHGAPPSLRVQGAGLGLIGLRTVPFVDRTEERDALWSALRRVESEGRPEVALLQGAEGIGRSRLARWIAHRAHELGVATVLWARHQATAGPAHGLAAMLSRHHGLFGLDPDAARKRLAERLGAVDRHHLEAVLRYAVADPDDGRTAPALSARHGVLAQHLADLATGPDGVQRVVLLVLDDVHQDAETLSFLAWLVQEPRELPVLALATADPLEALPAGLAPLLEAVTAHPRCATTAIGALPPGDARALVTHLLGLEPRLRDAVVERSGGHPLHAIQQVGEWVQRGVLAATADGFALTDQAELAEPGTAGPSGVREALAALITDQRAALERGVVLGRVVDWAEWRAACAEDGLPTGPEAIEALVDRRLASLGDEGWSLTHEGLRIAVLEGIPGAVLEGHHRACAAALEKVHPSGARGLEARRAQHHAAAGDLDAALSSLQTALVESLRTEAPAATEALIDHGARWLDRAEAGPADLRRLQLGVHRAEWLRNQAEYERSTAEAEDVVRHARAAGHTRELAQALASLGHTARQRGELSEARERLQEATDLHAEAGAMDGVAGCMVAQAIVERRLGNLDASIRLLDRVIPLYDRLGLAWGVARARGELANAWMAKGRVSEARAHYEGARADYDRLGIRDGLAYTLNAIGCLALRDERWDEAEATLVESRTLYEQLDSPQAVIPDLNLSAIELHRGDHRAARERQERALARFDALDWRIYAASVHLELLVPVGALDDWEAWDAHLAAGIEAIRALGTAEQDFADTCEKAAEIAAGAGHLDRARQALDFAIEQWEEVKQPLKARSARRRRDRL